MSHDDAYESWRRERRQATPSADFTDRVMSAVTRNAVGVGPRRRWHVAAAVVAAGLVGEVIRLAAVLSAVLVFPTGGY